MFLAAHFSAFYWVFILNWCQFFTTIDVHREFGRHNKAARRVPDIDKAFENGAWAYHSGPCNRYENLNFTLQTNSSQPIPFSLKYSKIFFHRLTGSTPGSHHLPVSFEKFWVGIYQLPALYGKLRLWRSTSTSTCISPTSEILSSLVYFYCFCA